MSGVVVKGRHKRTVVDQMRYQCDKAVERCSMAAYMELEAIVPELGKIGKVVGGEGQLEAVEVLVKIAGLRGKPVSQAKAAVVPAGSNIVRADTVVFESKAVDPNKEKGA
jgi:hypothetical protein